MKKKYKLIIFDLDGTLIDSMPYHFKAFKKTLTENGVNIKDATLRKFMGVSTKEIFQEIKKKHNFPGTVKDVREERRYHYFKSLKNKNIIFPGIEKTLKELKKEYKLAIATGSSRVTARYSTNKNFQELFDVIITLNDVKKGKPSPDQILLAAKKTKTKLSECLMVGDSIYDLISAKRAGVDSVGVLTGYTSKKELQKYEPKRVISSVNRITTYLNQN